MRKAGGYPRAQSRIAQHASTFAIACRIPYSLDLEGLRRIPPRVFGIMSLEPAMAALTGLIVLRELLHWSQWIAVLCVVAASAGDTRGARPDA
jgi:inner membrane transporter RhtA